MIYLDNNSTTRIAPEVKEKILPFLDEEFGNPASANAPGARARNSVLRSRETIAQALSASPAEIVFTSGATESNHAAIIGALGYFSGCRRRIVSTMVEHPSTLRLLQSLKEFEVVLLPVDHDGMIDADEADRAITQDTALVSMMWANNETGIVFPIEEVARMAKNRGALFHTDAVQAIGRLPLSFRTSGIDLLSFSGHKIHAPKGVGALLQRKGLSLPPFIHGSQERGRRGGTENVMGIAALGAAIGLIEYSAAVESSRNGFEQRILKELPGTRVNGIRSPRVGNTSNITFPGTVGEEILVELEKRGVVASQAAACQSGSHRPSHVLLAMGMDAENAKSTLRFSLSRYNDRDEVEMAAQIVASTVRAISRKNT